MTLTTFNASLYGTRGDFAIVKAGTYADGTPALRVMDPNGELWGTLTVCIPGTPLEEGEYLVKTWSENENMAAAVLASGEFTDTGKRVPSGYVQAQVWTFNR